MTAVCGTFESIESRAESTVALSIHARRVRDSFFAATVGRLLLHILNHKLNGLTTHLRCGTLDSFTDDQLIELSGTLKQLDVRLVKITDVLKDKGWEKHTIFQELIDGTDDLESIIENIYLAVNPDFHKVVSSAIGKLHTEVEESAPLLR